MSHKIVFMGTPDFAVTSLEKIVESGIEVAAVVTAPDRKSGRGQKLTPSPVKNAALEFNIPVLQPEKLKDEGFIQELASFNADLFVVVAFRMLPKEVWALPKNGTINLHGSLLPQYRGAAPINWAIINGETETGATTFFIDEKIDTGAIIDAIKIPISETMNAGDLHDKMMVEGAELLVKTIHHIFNNTIKTTSQKEVDPSNLKDAPKIFKEDCKIIWSEPTSKIYNKIRGLSPYPAAFTIIEDGDTSKILKIFNCSPVSGSYAIGEIVLSDEHIIIGTLDGGIELKVVQLEGKKRMAIEDFRRGFDISNFKISQK